MSELSVLEKAIENSQKEVKELIEEQRKSINQTGEINKQLQIDLTKAQEELKATGTRLFDLEQKLAGNSPDQTAQKSFAQRVSEDLMKGWDGSRTKAKVTSFDKAIGSGAASAGALVQPQQLPGILMPGLRRLTVRDLLAQGRITSNALEYVRENVFTNAAA
ncbi:TPA: phage major capsid protein, partial [Klebsiella pneumoniae]|nr:phage major capsid protein [Klebsiella pneumoniae]